VAATIVIEDASFETGARLAGLLALSLERFETVRLVLRDSGAVQTWLSEHVHGPIQTCNRANFPYEKPFSQRVSAARELLDSDSSDVAYIFGLGASDFAVAARSQNRRVVMHAYQTKQQILHMLGRDQAKCDCASFCDALLVSEDYAASTMSRLFGRSPARVENLGLRVDFEWLSRLSTEQPAVLFNAQGEQLVWGGNFVVGGRRDTAEDALFFASVARESPDIDFAWLGTDPHREADGESKGGMLAAGLPNLYAALRPPDPWSSLPSLGAYIVCSRESDPAVPVAASALGVSPVGFSSGAATEFLGRYGVLCHGKPDASHLSALLSKIAGNGAAAAVSGAERRRRQMDIEGCVDTVMRIMVDVRLTEPD